jgi:hypothetical protein
LGILRKTGDKMWCFDGQFVVDCVANVGRKQSLLWWANVGQVFEVYFMVVRIGVRDGSGSPCWGERISEVIHQCPLNKLPLR